MGEVEKQYKGILDTKIGGLIREAEKEKDIYDRTSDHTQDL